MRRRQFAILVVCAFAIDGQSGDIAVLNLQTTDGVLHRMRTADVPATAVLFVSAACPMSAEYSERINQLAADYAPRRVRILMVNSNTNESNAEVEKQRAEARLSVPVYRDNGAVADLLGATATPTAVVIDGSGAIRYLGMIDNSRIPERVTKQPLRSALDSVLAGRAVELPRTRVMGCSIKSGR